MLGAVDDDRRGLDNAFVDQKLGARVTMIALKLYHIPVHRIMNDQPVAT